jgi:hypothetical protein
LTRIGVRHDEITINDTEIVLLRQLRDDGEQTISGNTNKLRRDLDRVIRAGYVNDVAISVDAAET